MLSTLTVLDALAHGESFDPWEPLLMLHSPTFAADSGCLTAHQIADLLAVVLWTDTLLIDEVEIVERPTRLGPTLARLESLLISLRPVAAARAELALLNGAVLLDGFEIWAARQRAVMQTLAAASREAQ